MAGNFNASAALVAQVLAARQRTVELAAGISLQYALPSQWAAADLVRATQAGSGDAVRATICEWARGWAGITQATLLGAGVGSTEPAPFAPELLDAYLADRPADTLTIAHHMVQQASAAATAANVAAGN